MDWVPFGGFAFEQMKPTRASDVVLMQWFDGTCAAPNLHAPSLGKFEVDTILHDRNGQAKHPSLVRLHSQAIRFSNLIGT